MKTPIKVCFTALAILLAVIPLLACGAPEAPAPTPQPPAPPPTPTGNQPPVIKSITITPDTTTVAYGATLTIVCNAEDPDGDTLTFSWSADAGTVDATRQTLTWKAPSFDKNVVISVKVDDGKGNTTTESRTITVTANRRPVITSLTPEATTIIPGGKTSITCEANDADGDKLSYTWSASGGTVSGQGKTITWQAAEKDGKPVANGNYVISVTVDDGKEGGTVKGECSITVRAEAITTIFKPIASESGSVDFAGNLATSWKVGDNAANKGVRAFFSFDISTLVGANIKEAKLTFTPKETVNPWTISSFLLVEQVKYGTRPLKGDDFHLEKIVELGKFASSPPGEIDVLLRITGALQPPAEPRFQVRLRLAVDTNFNSTDDYLSFSDAALTITYSSK